MRQAALDSAAESLSIYDYGHGGAIAANAVEGMVVRNCKFMGNSAGGDGGSLYIKSSSDSVTIESNCQFLQSTAGNPNPNPYPYPYSYPNANPYIGNNGGAIALGDNNQYFSVKGSVLTLNSNPIPNPNANSNPNPNPNPKLNRCGDATV